MPLTHEVHQDLAIETVARGFDLFRRLEATQQGWDPAAGASVTTYFVGCCVREFANVYRFYEREQNRTAWALPLPPDELVSLSAELGGFTSRSAEATALDRLTVDEGLEQLDHFSRKSLLLSEYGSSYTEIGKELGVSRGAVAQILHRHRKRTSLQRSHVI